MNKHDAHDYIPLLQAIGDGKIIQFKRFGNKWEDLDTVDFSYSAKYYRVKPEPRIFKLMIHKYTGVIEDNDFISYDPDIWEPITVQEVLQ